MTSPLYLTFDDGPDPEWTPRVIEVLACYDAQATFFVLGWRVREHPSLIGDLLRAGHRVELHGDAHFDHEILTADQLDADTRAALAVLAAEGVIPQWWRVPFGRAGEHTAAVAAEHGLRLVGWDADTFDWRGDTWPQQSEPVRETAERGGVLVLHDAVTPGVGRTECENTVEIVDRLLETAALMETPVLALPDASTDEPITTQPGPAPGTETVDALDEQDALDQFAIDAAGVARRNVTQ